MIKNDVLYRFFPATVNPFRQTCWSEIAGEQGISRQGVHDLIKRCDKILQDYESKLHLVERFMAAKEKIGEIEQLTAEDTTDPEERMRRIRELSRSLLKEW